MQEPEAPPRSFVGRTLDWLDSRTAYRALLAPVRRRVLAKGPSWWYSTASCLIWLLVVQLVTGLLLMATYCPSLEGAWGSVHFIGQSPSGTLVRGLHYFAAQAMIVLFGIHVVRVLLAGAFRAPRELIWITGLILFPLMIVWTISGNPLSGTLDGISQIEVEGNIIASTPVVGPTLRDLLIGGDRVGQLTLTHLYALHVGVLPLAVGLLLALHLAQVYRHGVAAEPLTKGSRAVPYWPFQTVRNMVVLTAVLVAVSVLAFQRGAPLGPPADADLPHTPRPEWYFLWLFELRRYFTGDWEFIATVVAPGLVLLVLLLVPSLDTRLSPRMSAALRVALIALGILVWGGLTGLSLWRDAGDAEFQRTAAAVAAYGGRARHLADKNGIPPEGAKYLLRRDPQSTGPLLFQRHCASCHPAVDAEGNGIVAATPSAPNLYGVGKADWIAGFLDPKLIRSEHVFGATKFKKGDMAGRLDEMFEEAEDDEARTKLQAKLRQAAVALEAEAFPPGKNDAPSEDVLAGRKAIAGSLACVDCHKFHSEGDLGSAPDLTAYASRQWLRGFIANPKHARFYGSEGNDRMPSFAADAATPDQNLLTAEQIELLVAWLRQEAE